MKSDATGKQFPKTDDEWKQHERQALDHIEDLEDPYDPKDAAAVEAFWQDALVIRDGDPKAVGTALRTRRQRGRQKAPTKEATTIRLSREVLAYFRGTSKGWQRRIDEILRAYVASQGREAKPK